MLSQAATAHLYAGVLVGLFILMLINDHFRPK